jgi:hypothetical protein
MNTTQLKNGSRSKFEIYTFVFMTILAVVLIAGFFV